MGATTNISKDQNDEQHHEPWESAMKKEQKQKTYEGKLIIHYTHEKWFHSIKQHMHYVYEAAFKNKPVSDVKMIVKPSWCKQGIDT